MRILDLLQDNLSICSVRTCASICKFWCMTPIHTLRSKGAKWHLLGFFGLSLYWHPQKVLQRTLLWGSLERTPLRTLTWGSLKEPYRVLSNQKLSATKNHLGVLYSTMWYSWRVLWRTPRVSYYFLAFNFVGALKTFYGELQNIILDIYDNRKIVL